MENKHALAILKNFNEWRRGAECRQPEPHLIGLAIDKGIEALDLSTQHAKMVEMLTKVKALQPLIEYPSDCLQEHLGEAQAIREMFNQLDCLLSSIKKGGSDE
ncbi:hypothetical protein [Sphingobacterium kyonggiense]